MYDESAKLLVDDKGRFVFLRGVFVPHEGEVDWRIGGPEQIHALIHDLEAALVTLKRKDDAYQDFLSMPEP